MAKELDGVWRTIGGRRVFIKNGKDLTTAMRESGKFKTKKDYEKEYYKKEKLGEPKDFKEGEKVVVQDEYGYGADAEYTVEREATLEEKYGKVNTNLRAYVLKDKYGNEIIKADTRIKKIKNDNNRDVLRKKYFGGDNFELYSQPKEVKDEINRKDFGLAKDFDEVLRDYEENENSDWYIDVVKSAQDRIAFRKEQEENLFLKKQYNSDKKELAELRKKHSSSNYDINRIEMLYNRIKEYEKNNK